MGLLLRGSCSGLHLFELDGVEFFLSGVSGVSGVSGESGVSGDSGVSGASGVGVVGKDSGVGNVFANSTNIAGDASRQLFFFAEVVFVVAFVGGDGAVFHFDDAGGEAVDEVAVVGDEDDGAGEGGDGVEEYVFGAHVEVVGGLVEEKEVGGRDENLCEGEAVAFAAGEDAEGLEDVVAGEEETAQ